METQLNNYPFELMKFDILECYDKNAIEKHPRMK